MLQKFFPLTTIVLFCLNAVHAEEMPPEASSATRDAYLQAQSMCKYKYYQAAAQKLAEVTSAVPRFAQAHYDYGKVLSKLGKNADAIKQFQEAEQYTQNDASMLYRLGSEFQQLGQRADAIRLYERYVFMVPDGPYGSYAKNALEEMKREDARFSTQTDSRGKDSYIEEELNGRTPWHRFQRSQMPIRVYVNGGLGVTGYQEIYDDILKQSFQEWQAASRGLISFRFVSNPEEKQLEVIWTNDVFDFENPTELGISSTRASGHRIVSSRIKIQTMDKEGKMPAGLKGTCLHEIGHAIGLMQHSPEPSDIMFRLSSKERTRLTSRDASTLVSLYSLPDDSH